MTDYVPPIPGITPRPNRIDVGERLFYRFLGRIHDRWSYGALFAPNRPPALRPRNRDAGRDIGRAIAAYRDDNDLDALIEELNDAGMYGTRLAIAVRVLTSGDALLCADCASTWVDRDNAPWSNTHEGRICENCLEHHVASHDGRLVDETTESLVYAATRYSRVGFTDGEWYTRDSSDIVPFYNAQDEYGYATRGAVDAAGWYIDEGGCAVPDPPESDGDDDDGIPAYHRHPLRSSYHNYFAEPPGSTEPDPPLGIELEVYATRRADIPGALASRGLDWIVETDGSLDDTHGCEIVSPPILGSAWPTVLPKLADALTECDAVGHNADGQYGLHISVARKWLSPLQEARVAFFLEAEQNKPLVQAIAQRSDIYCSRRGIGALPPSDQKVAVLGGLGYASARRAKHNDKGIRGGYGGRFVPASFDDGWRLEFRIFRSNTRLDRLAKNLQFVQSLIAWTAPTSCTGCGWNHEDYILWLRMFGDRYPDLVEYLSRPIIPIKSGSIPNTWGDLRRPKKDRNLTLNLGA